jgi:hypothetical protein
MPKSPSYPSIARLHHLATNPICKRLKFGVWSLKLGVFLELGFWKLEFFFIPSDGRFVTECWLATSKLALIRD